MAEDYPRHIVAVSAYITNGSGEVLLVKTRWRQDTWEPPGGQVHGLKNFLLRRFFILLL